VNPLELIVDAVPALIAYVDREQRYGFVNRAYEAWFGCARAAILGRSLREFLGDTRYLEIRPYVERALAGESVTFESGVMHRDGTPRFVRVVYVPDTAPDGVVRGYVSLVSDITDIRVTETALRDQAVALDRARAEAESASRGKDEFLATLSHELRTPLSAVVGWVRLLREGSLNAEEQERALEVIERNARVQVQLIEDLLDISRIVAGKAQLDLRPVHPVTLIDAVVDSMRPAATAKGVQIETSVDLRAGPVAGDADRLQQVLWNLVANAIKFTDRGGRVDIRLARGASTVTVEVRDTGEGITREMLPYVFERFRQGEGGSTRKHGGLGIGLALVKHLVEAHGGTVVAESPGRGRGTVMTVTLPLIAFADPVGIPRSSRATLRPMIMVPTASLQGCRVLVVDSDPDAVDLFASVLRRAGAEVRKAASAAAAMEAMSAAPVDVVLADIEMPGDHGDTLVQRLRAQGFRTPVVAVTAYGSIDERVRALAAGFDTHIAKPIEAEELVAVVHRLVARAGAG
jgi:PAS domain S-box-containing protein